MNSPFSLMRRVTVFFLLVAINGGASTALAMDCTVPTSISCPTIQAGLNQALPGDTITVLAGVYAEKISFPQSGNAGSGYIMLAGQPGAVLDGTLVGGSNMVLIDSRSYVKLIGFEIRNNLNVRDGSGVRILGSGSHIEIRNNVIHDIRGKDAMGITVYGTASSSISDLIIDGNEVYDCDPARSEALTLNGNVELFEVTHNYVHDVNNIGIDFIGGETSIQPDTAKVVRNGVCRGNRVFRARSVYEGGFAGAIYVDGGRDIVIERNITSESDLGLEVGAENNGILTQNISVRDNVIYHNDKVGIVFGGFSAAVGRVQNCSFTNNTLFENDTLGAGLGELWIQFGDNNTIRNNIFDGGQDVLLRSEAPNVGNLLDYNLWRTTTSAPTFVWNGIEQNGLAAFQAASGQDAHAISSDPQFVNAALADFHLRSVSAARNAGDPGFVTALGEVDLDGAPRISAARVDIGADEITCGDAVLDAGESCDDGNLVDCDGCDSNCTASATCGNGIRCGTEQCDDGNLLNGDCCAAACTFEPAATSCSDGNLCTNFDACDGAGVCIGSAVPLPALQCHEPILSGKASLQIKNNATNDGRDSVMWKWGRGQATTSLELGDPLSTTEYALCVYDQSMQPQPILAASVPPGGTCAARSCWKTMRNGFRFASRSGSAAAHGVTRIVLTAGVDGKAKVSLTARGVYVDTPTLGLAPTVTAQLRNGVGACWGAIFSNVARNDATQYRAKSD